MLAVVQGPVEVCVENLVQSCARARWHSGPRHQFCVFQLDNTAMIYAGTALLALGNGLMWPSLLSILARAADRRVQGTVQEFAGSIAAVASIIGLLAGGFLYGFLGPRVFVICAALTLLTCALAFAIPFRVDKERTAR